MSRIDALAEQFHQHVAAPWQKYLAGVEKIIFVIYPKDDELRLRKRIGLFEQRSQLAGHPWRLIDLTDTFPAWLSAEDYKEEYFRVPEDLELKLDQFRDACVQKISDSLTSNELGEDSIVALLGVSSLFGLIRLHDVLECVQANIKGRLVVFFPGSFEQNNYRLLDARDGWNYLAVPISVSSSV